MSYLEVVNRPIQKQLIYFARIISGDLVGRNGKSEPPRNDDRLIASFQTSYPTGGTESQKRVYSPQPNRKIWEFFVRGVDLRGDPIDEVTSYAKTVWFVRAERVNFVILITFYDDSAKFSKATANVEQKEFKQVSRHKKMKFQFIIFESFHAPRDSLIQ